MHTKKKNNDRLIMLSILFVGAVALLISTLAPRPLAESITEQFSPKQPSQQVDE